MAAAPNSEVESSLASKSDYRGDVARINHADDECGPTVDTSNEDLARVVIFRVARLDHASFDLAAKLPNSDHSILHSVALVRVFSLFRSDFTRRRDSSLTRDLTAALC